MDDNSVLTFVLFLLLLLLRVGPGRRQRSFTLRSTMGCFFYDTAAAFPWQRVFMVPVRNDGDDSSVVL